MTPSGKLARLDRTGDEERHELVAELSDARAQAAELGRRTRPWIAAAAGIAAAAAVAAGVARVRRARSGRGRVRKVSKRVREELERYKPRPIPITILFALLRTPAIRRAIASGAVRMIPRDRTVDEEDGDRKERGGSDTAPRGETRRVERAAPPPGEASHAGKLEARAAEARDREKANDKAPSKDKGEEKAKQTLESLKHSPFKRKVRFVTDLFKEAFSAFMRDEALTRAAALAYYTILSLAPLLVIVIAVAGIAFGAEHVRNQILGQIGQLVGADAAKTIGTMMQKASQPSKSIPAAVIGVATLLFGAGGVFGYLHDMFNKVWAVPKKEGGGIWQAVKDRFLSLAMVLGTGFLLLVSLVVSAGLSALGKQFGDDVGIVFNVLHQIVSWAVVGLLFALIFRFLPDTRIAWRDVWIGAGITSLLFVIGQFLIGLYLGRSSVASVYGGAGSLLIVLLWTYYSGLILFFGAEVTQVFANKWGSRKNSKRADPSLRSG
ncbi:MAG TPA: YhjD/YihY/BrkB family envelope integrity protein [Thermoanaerobaculia bacterium]|nr:YhjD/YihY/BrkB family envelope integrity protein [Thermoanaerobaculia bacterium]